MIVLKVGIGEKNVEEIPCYLCEEIWKQRNLVLFVGKITSVWKVDQKEIGIYGEFSKGTSTKNLRNLSDPFLNPYVAIGYFDGASQEASMKCGVGAILKLNDTRCFHMKMACGGGSNTKGEFLALRSVLFFCQIVEDHSCVDLR